ncbi:DUF4236 domain-containing protein [Pararhodospirillum oryzae]|uniref:DUF4236 domain-containing protein n=1 Tax=Pararhodospirillum oryzae TaxID=478448 RepID=A0A512H5C3_9PROT|nr:DUF4236 domain-containing protein [Pararhodospirillum oryzae]GEO80633.1 hypothetical protein ROR02_07640 [Pararhodospirillum oryzae]
MGFRFRQSIRLAPGLRLNLGKRGTSLTVGRPGASVNLGRQGARATVGLPGTGLSYSTKVRPLGGATGTLPRWVRRLGQGVFFLLAAGLVASSVMEKLGIDLSSLLHLPALLQ